MRLERLEDPRVEDEWVDEPTSAAGEGDFDAAYERSEGTEGALREERCWTGEREDVVSMASWRPHGRDESWEGTEKRGSSGRGRLYGICDDGDQHRAVRRLKRKGFRLRRGTQSQAFVLSELCCRVVKAALCV